MIITTTTTTTRVRRRTLSRRDPEEAAVAVTEEINSSNNGDGREDDCDDENDNDDRPCSSKSLLFQWAYRIQEHLSLSSIVLPSTATSSSSSSPSPAIVKTTAAVVLRRKSLIAFIVVIFWTLSLVSSFLWTERTGGVGGHHVVVKGSSTFPLDEHGRPSESRLRFLVIQELQRYQNGWRPTDFLLSAKATSTTTTSSKTSSSSSSTSTTSKTTPSGDGGTTKDVGGGGIAAAVEKRLRGTTTSDAETSSSGGRGGTEVTSPEDRRFQVDGSGDPVHFSKDSRLSVKVGCNWVRGTRASLELELDHGLSDEQHRRWNRSGSSSLLAMKAGTAAAAAGVPNSNFRFHRPHLNLVDDGNNNNGNNDDVDPAIVLHDWLEMKAWTPHDLNNDNDINETA